jgi:hypothetical protein
MASRAKTGNAFVDFLKNFGFAIAFFAVIAVVLVRGFSETATANAEEQRRMLHDNIMRAVVSCYAVEGSYPESMDYLKNNYGIAIDSDKFVVHYNVFASNIMPDFDILEVNPIETASDSGEDD